MFKRLPFSISSPPEYSNLRMDKELPGIEGVKCHMDDILVIGRDHAGHDQRFLIMSTCGQDHADLCIMKTCVDRLVDRRCKLNLEKCLFSQTRLQYLVKTIDSEGARKNLSKAEPQNIADLKRFFNHLMKFCSNLAVKTQPKRLAKGRECLEGPAQQEAILDSVQSLCRSCYLLR